MPILDYYDDNRRRAWPFVTDVVNVPGAPSGSINGLPDEAIVDLSIVFLPLAEFDPSSHSVYLYAVSLISGDIVFDVRSTAPKLVNHRLLFSVDPADPPYSLAYGVVDRLGGTPEVCDDAEGWMEGYLVVGDLEDMGLPRTHNPSKPAIFEPATIQSLHRRLVLSLNVANTDRTKVRPGEACDNDFGEGATPKLTRSIATCLESDVKFGRGRNLEPQIDLVENTITFTAAPGAGLGRPCEEIPTYEGETPPINSVLLTGGPSCDQLIAGVNGARVKDFQLRTGAGIVVTPIPAQSKVVIDSDMASLLSCDLEA